MEPRQFLVCTGVVSLWSCTLLPCGCGPRARNPPAWTAANPNPNPRLEYHLVVQEYERAREAAAQRRAEQPLHLFSPSRGTWPRDRNAPALVLEEEVGDMAGRIATDPQLQSAIQRLRRAEARLKAAAK